MNEKEVKWNDEMRKLEDADRLVLLIDELKTFTYREIQDKVRENKHLFNECFNGLHDTIGVAEPVSRKLNYYLNVMEFTRRIGRDSHGYCKTPLLMKEADRISEKQ